MSKSPKTRADAEPVASVAVPAASALSAIGEDWARAAAGYFKDIGERHRGTLRNLKTTYEIEATCRRIRVCRALADGLGGAQGPTDLTTLPHDAEDRALYRMGLLTPDGWQETILPQINRMILESEEQMISGKDTQLAHATMLELEGFKAYLRDVERAGLDAAAAQQRRTWNVGRDEIHA